MKVAILGTRGIPNRYGGFEQMAEHLSAGLVQKGHSVYVYNSHNHPYQEKTWNGVHIVHCYDPENRLGTAGQFIYDLNCIADARKRDFDAILILGYTSSSLWGRFYPRQSTIIFNMDGLEWKRTKYSAPVKRFLLYAEKLAVRFSNNLVADSLGIQSYLQERYNAKSEYIAYGASILHNEDESLLNEYGAEKGDYYLLIARFEPENNIETILDGFSSSNATQKFLVIGNTGKHFGRHIHNKFGRDKRIQFLGAIYDEKKVHTLKTFSRLYFHGHSVGGTNPSLLEAMASKALIAAHNNPFNRAILQDDAFYFSDAADVKRVIEGLHRGAAEHQMVCNNLDKINQQFTWSRIIEQYEQYILRCIKNRS